MARLCGECGYDVTRLPLSERGRRSCPECGHVGRGVRPGIGVWWVVRASLRPLRFTLPAILLTGATAGVLDRYERPPSLLPEAIKLACVLLAGYGALQAFAGPLAAVEVWLRTIPRRRRRIAGLGAWAAGAAAAGALVAAAVSAAMMVL